MTTLNLKNIASSAFSFLETDFGFTLTVANLEHLRFEGNGIFVSIRFDSSRSYELGVQLGQIHKRSGGSERLFNLGQVLRLAGAPEEKWLVGVQITEQASLERFTEEMAAALKTHGLDLLRGEKVAFERLEALSEKESRAYQHETDLRLAREDAQRAWRQHDYAGVVAALEPFECDLSPSETKRLELSRIRC